MSAVATSALGGDRRQVFAFPDLPRTARPRTRAGPRRVHGGADDQQDTRLSPSQPPNSSLGLPDLRAANYPRADHAAVNPELPGKQLTGSARVRPLPDPPNVARPQTSAEPAGARWCWPARSLAAVYRSGVWRR